MLWISNKQDKHEKWTVQNSKMGNNGKFLECIVPLESLKLVECKLPPDIELNWTSQVVDPATAWRYVCVLLSVFASRLLEGFRTALHDLASVGKLCQAQC
jgi:hypothetical protein